LLVLISVSASYPHGSGLQGTGNPHNDDMFQHQHPDSEELCNSLRRYMDVLLRSTTFDCQRFPEKSADKDFESCLSSPSGIIIIKKCVEEHNKTSEAAECLVTFLKSKSTSANQSICLCQSMFDSFLSLYSTSQLVCTKTFLDDLVNEHRDANFLNDAVLLDAFKDALNLNIPTKEDVEKFTELWNVNKLPSLPPKSDIKPIPYGAVEMRWYPSAYFACTEAEAAIDRTEEGEMSTKLLAYIGGRNKQYQQLGMTTPPFLTKMSVWKGGAGIWVTKEMCYYIQENFQGNPPRPNDPDVFIEKKAERVVFIKTFMGDGSALSDSSWILENETFRAKMADMGMANEVEFDQFYTASYDWWSKHEVMLEKKQPNLFNLF